MNVDVLSDSSASGSDEDSSSQEEVEQKKELPSRSTRGLRMNKLLGEAKEADHDFWEQDAWNIDDNDAQYSSEEEEEDIFDLDFGEDENPDDDVHDEEGTENTRMRKKAKTISLAYREPYRTHLTAKRTTGQSKSRPEVLASFQRQLRKSTVEQSSVFSQALEKRTIEMKTSQGRKKVPVMTPLTQQALIAEAIRTEITNTRSLNRLQKLAEEKKKSQSTDSQAPPRHEGTIRYHSKLGQLKTITFQMAEDKINNTNIQSAIFYNSGKANHHRHHHSSRHHTQYSPS